MHHTLFFASLMFNQQGRDPVPSYRFLVSSCIFDCGNSRPHIERVLNKSAFEGIL